MPSMFATCTPRRSTSSAGMTTTHESAAHRVIRAKYSSRAAGVSSFESVSPSRRLASPGRSTHAATTSGPAQAPRPASSTPATGPSPCRCSVVCRVQLPAERRTTARAGRNSAGNNTRRPATTTGRGHVRRRGRNSPSSRSRRRSATSGSRPSMPSAAGAPASPSPSAAHRLRVGRRDRAEPVERHDDEPGLADHVVDRHGAVAGHARVGGVVAAVAHHPQLARGHRDRPERVLPGRARLGQEVDVGLVERLAVDEHPVARVAAGMVWPPTAMTRLMKSFSSGGASPMSDPSPCRARTTTLLGGSAVNSLRPAVGAAEDDDVARRRVAEPVGHLVDQHPVVLAAGAAVQRGLHRSRRDHVDLREERLDEERQHQRDDDEDRQFLPERRPAAPAPAALAARLLAVGGGRALVGRFAARRRWRPGKPAGPSSASSATGSAALAKPVGTVGSSTGSGGPEPSQAVPSSAGWAPVHVCGRVPARGGGTSLWMRRAVPSVGGNG